VRTTIESIECFSYYNIDEGRCPFFVHHLTLGRVEF
jgi:hypothetical protein